MRFLLLSSLALTGLFAVWGSASATGASAAQAARDAPTVTVSEAVVLEPRHAFRNTVILMTLRSRSDATLVKASTPLADSLELHRIVRAGEEVSMQTVEAIPLAAGQEVRLKMGEGGYHLMAVHLRRDLTAGQSVPLQLVFRSRGGKTWTSQVLASVVPGRHQQEGDQEDQH